MVGAEHQQQADEDRSISQRLKRLEKHWATLERRYSGMTRELLEIRVFTKPFNQHSSTPLTRLRRLEEILEQIVDEEEEALPALASRVKELEDRLNGAHRGMRRPWRPWKRKS